MGSYGSSSYDDVESNRPMNDVDTMATFSDKAVRMGFIRKVYGILMVQLAVTCAIIAIFTTESVKLYTRQNSWMFFLALAVMLVCLISMACCGDVRRKAPVNYIFLSLFTLAEGFMLGCATSVYKVDEVLLAVGITAVLVLALTIFAFQTKIDFTAMGGVLMVALLCLMLFGICLWIFGTSKILNIVYASIGAFIFAVYIIFDTQMMLGGTHKYSVSPEEYIFAALNLYLDIINLFIYILSIIGNANSN